jgi:benzoate-CoA ligase
VESHLLAHAEVAQAVVVAANDADGLEKPVAFVQLNRGALADEQTLIEFCKLGLPAFKRPRRIVIVTGYPTTATGKIRRVELREQASVILQALPDPTGLTPDGKVSR